MSLIKCPECNKEISDKATACPNCGFPIQEINKPKFSNTGYNICPKCGWIDIRISNCPKCNTEMMDCHTTFDEWLTMGVDGMWQWRQEIYNKYVINSPEFNEKLFNETFKKEKAEHDYYASYPRKPSEPKITCPYCQSTNTKKIGIVSRSVSAGLFGLGSKKIGKQWHCNNCNSDF